MDTQGGWMEFRILGPPQVLNGCEEVDLGSWKQRALLGLLLLNAGRVVHALVGGVRGTNEARCGCRVASMLIPLLRRIP